MAALTIPVPFAFKMPEILPAPPTFEPITDPFQVPLNVVEETDDNPVKEGELLPREIDVDQLLKHY